MCFSLCNGGRLFLFAHLEPVLVLQVEIQLALSLGVTPDKIIYAHTTKPLSHIKYACTHGVNMMTFDSEDELLKISLCHAKAK